MQILIQKHKLEKDLNKGSENICENTKYAEIEYLPKR